MTVFRFFATSPTVAMCVAELYRARKYTRLVTNSIGVLQSLPSEEITSVQLIGGSYLPAINACVGNNVVAELRTSSCTIGLLGISGLSEAAEVFVRHDQEVEVLYEIMRSVKTLFIVADGTKLGERDQWQIVDLEQSFQLAGSRLERIEILTNDPDDKALTEKQRMKARNTIEAIKKLSEEKELSISVRLAPCVKG